MEEFKEKQKRQRVIVVEKYDYGEYEYKIDKIFTNVKKCYDEHFRCFFQNHYNLKDFSYQSFLKAVKNNEGVFENKDFVGFFSSEHKVRFRYTVHQLE